MLEIRIQASTAIGGPLVTLIGDASLAEVDRLSLELRRVQSSHPSRAAIDVSGVSFIASLAIGTLVEFASGVRTRHGRVALVGAQGMVLDAFQRLRMDALFTICPTAAAVEQCWGPAQQAQSVREASAAPQSL
ncbi:MAG: STAS domain-containing protein [Phycisphaeraceae bacterium]|nr:STAS domain-containing protein [Phycisphaeraceae bacterium]